VSSSTFSSKRWWLGTIIIAVAVSLAMLEVVTRVVLYPASKDFVRFAQYPLLAESLVNRPGTRVALIGNSATEEGVDLATVVAELQRRDLGHVHVEMFVADASEITTWRYMLERYFWKPGFQPDLIVITFFDSLLSDDSEKEIGRLAQFFTSPSDWPDVFRTDLSGLSQRITFALSLGWATYAAKDRIKARVLGSLVPNYKRFESALAADAARHARHLGRTVATSGNYHALRRLLARAREVGSPICFIAFPMKTSGSEAPYELDVQAQWILQEAGMELIDLRAVPELTPNDYRDIIHLNESGRVKYSRRLAQILAGRLIVDHAGPLR